MQKVEQKRKRRACGEGISGVYILILLCFSVYVLSGCNENEQGRSSSKDEQSFVELNAFKVPVFSSAEEQLNYTRSWFADVQEKRAALEVFVKLYPQRKKLCGMAALDLAYLQLGKDYRFAPQYSSFAALKDYLAITAEYTDYPDIVAKAYWYIGWIYSDLLQDGEKGIEYYRKIVKTFPAESVSILPPAPWVSIIYQPDQKIAAFNRPPNNNWAALALVEIIRQSEGDDAWQAFTILWQNYRQNSAAGFGLRLILQKRVHRAEVVKMANEYMEKEFSNVHILSDIRREITSSAEGERGEGQ